MRYPTLPQSIAIGGVVFKYGDALRAFVRAALGDEESLDVDTALLARNDPDWAGWLDQIYGPDGWKPLLVRLQANVDDITELHGERLLPKSRVPRCPDRRPRRTRARRRSCRDVSSIEQSRIGRVPDADHASFFSVKVALFQSLILDFLQRHGPA
jgi:hypothetical protein